MQPSKTVCLCLWAVSIWRVIFCYYQTHSIAFYFVLDQLRLQEQHALELVEVLPEVQFFWQTIIFLALIVFLLLSENCFSIRPQQTQHLLVLHVQIVSSMFLLPFHFYVLTTVAEVLLLTCIRYITYFTCCPRLFLFTQCSPGKSKGWTTHDLRLTLFMHGHQVSEDYVFH